MDREILFRGQTRRCGEKVNLAGEPVDGNWVYGGILQGTGDYSIIYGSADSDNISASNLEKHVVYTDTVGQYTGKSVKTGKVFDGYICRSIDGLFLVVWDDEKAAFMMQFYDGFNERLYLEEMWEDAEVIGNIHDNPELVGGQHE